MTELPGYEFLRSGGAASTRTPTVRSYVPERLLLEGKTTPTCRAFCEEIALLKARDGLEILASRGLDLTPGRSFFDLVLREESEQDFLLTALVRHPRVLLRGDRGPILIYADAMATAGRILAVLPHFETVAVSAAMTMLGRRDFVVSNSCGSPCSACAPDMDTCRTLDSLLYDIDRMFNNLRVRSLGDYCRLIGEFSGCADALRPRSPEQMPQTPAEMDRMALSYLEECLKNR